jgi:hypothetical protein
MDHHHQELTLKETKQNLFPVLTAQHSRHLLYPVPVHHPSVTNLEDEEGREERLPGSIQQTDCDFIFEKE